MGLMSRVSQSPVLAGTAGVRCRPSAAINQPLSVSHCCPRWCCAGHPRAPPPPVHHPTALGLSRGLDATITPGSGRSPCGTEASLLRCSAAQRCPWLWWCLTSRTVAAPCLCTSVLSDKQAGWTEPACPLQHGSAGTAGHRDSQPLVHPACSAWTEAEHWGGSVLSASCCGLGHCAARGFNTSVSMCAGHRGGVMV